MLANFFIYYMKPLYVSPPGFFRTEKNSKSTGIRTLEIKNLDDFKKLTLSKVNKTKVKSIEHNKEKWIKYFLNEEEIDLLRKVAAMKKVKSLSNYLDVDVGVVTGKNDFFILSKGHAALAYYVILMMKNFFSKSFLIKNYISNGGLLGGHPDRNISKGIDYCSGSLGNGLSVACGVAMSYLKDKKKNKVLTIIGDGECNEGMIWEAALFAGHNRLKNLYLIIDYNRQQGFGKTTEVLNLDSLKKKFLSFRWNVVESNGHKFSELQKAKDQLYKKKNNRPNLIIANTIKGKGIPFYENTFESHYKILTQKEYIKLKKK